MRVHATLTIKIVYDDADSLDEPRERLNYAANHLAGEGLLSGDSDMTVDTWSHEVKVEEAR